MKLVERYVDEVGQNLPEKMRTDIENEIRSLIEDRLSDRCAEQNLQEPNEEIIKEILAELGSPEAVAAAYLPDRYLVGPKNFSLFWRIVKFALLGFGIALLVSFVVQVFIPDGQKVSTIEAFLELIAGYLQGGLQIFGTVVLIFALIEWGQRKADVRLNLWTPQFLEEPAPQKVSRAGQIWDAIFAVAFLIIFNLYPQWVGINLYQNGNWVHVPVLTQAFYQFLPIINVQFALSLALAVYLASRGVWESVSEWLDVGVKVISIIVASLLLSVGPLLDMSANAFFGTGWDISTIMSIQKQVIPILNVQFDILLVVIIVINVIKIAKVIMRKMRGGIPYIMIKR